MRLGGGGGWGEEGEREERKKVRVAWVWMKGAVSAVRFVTLSDQTPSHNHRGQGRGEVWNAREERIQVCAELERREMGGGGGGGDTVYGVSRSSGLCRIRKGWGWTGEGEGGGLQYIVLVGLQVCVELD